MFPWLAGTIFNKMAYLRMFNSKCLGTKCDPLACGATNLFKHPQEFRKLIRITRLNYLQPWTIAKPCQAIQIKSLNYWEYLWRLAAPQAKGSYFIPKNLELSILSYVHFVENGPQPSSIASLNLAIFDKVWMTQDALLQMLRSKIWPLSS